MLDAILPPYTVVAEAFGDPADAALLPEEHVWVARAVPARVREFTTGRYCARTALGRLGVRPRPIPRGERGLPLWPDGVVGSITHCAGYRAAAVARAADALSIGIDAEPNAPLPDEVLALTSLPAERARLAGLAAAAPGIAWDRLLFSAKESVYKAWFPVARTFLDFHEAEVEFDPATATFRATVRQARRAPGEPGEMTGRFAVRDGLAVTAVVLGR